MKAHGIKEKGLTRFSESTMLCGLIGWADAIASNEFVTVEGSSFAAFENLAKVTCARCLKSANSQPQT